MWHYVVYRNILAFRFIVFLDTLQLKILLKVSATIINLENTAFIYSYISCNTCLPRYLNVFFFFDNVDEHTHLFWFLLTTEAIFYSCRFTAGKYLSFTGYIKRCSVWRSLHWGVTPCSLANSHRPFEGSLSLHLQGQRVRVFLSYFRVSVYKLKWRNISYTLISSKTPLWEPHILQRTASLLLEMQHGKF